MCVPDTLEILQQNDIVGIGWGDIRKQTKIKVRSGGRNIEEINIKGGDIQKCFQTEVEEKLNDVIGEEQEITQILKLAMEIKMSRPYLRTLEFLNEILVYTKCSKTREQK